MVFASIFSYVLKTIDFGEGSRGVTIIGSVIVLSGFAGLGLLKKWDILTFAAVLGVLIVILIIWGFLKKIMNLEKWWTKLIALILIGSVIITIILFFLGDMKTPGVNLKDSVETDDLAVLQSNWVVLLSRCEVVVPEEYSGALRRDPYYFKRNSDLFHEYGKQELQKRKDGLREKINTLIAEIPTISDEDVQEEKRTKIEEFEEEIVTVETCQEVFTEIYEKIKGIDLPLGEEIVTAERIEIEEDMIVKAEISIDSGRMITSLDDLSEKGFPDLEKFIVDIESWDTAEEKEV